MIDVAGVLDTPLKPVTIKNLKINKSYNCKIMSATEKLGNQSCFFWGGWGYICAGNFVGLILRGFSGMGGGWHFFFLHDQKSRHKKMK